jgi:TfoX/Sxy family transcriptional regulator of competence genes
MAYDEGLVQIWRDALVGTPNLSEKKMFGGIAILLNGNMLCGVHKDGAMIRVGKDNDALAKELPGVKAMMFTKKPMAGWLDVAPSTMEDTLTRTRLLAMALNFVQELPPK